MLSDDYFYYKLLRKYVITFGNLFNKVTMIRRSADLTEIQRIKVPISYAPKEKYVTRMEGDPDLMRQVQAILPRMSFEITGITYDPARKQNSMVKIAKGETTSRVTTAYMGVPYDINFQLTIYARNIDDGTHILEQILPYFNPDYTETINPIPELGFLKDIPIILDDVNQSVSYEGDWEAVRYCYWTLNFSLKGYFWGPISSPKIIRKVTANIFNDPSLVTGNIIRINTGTGNNGTFQIEDTVYQGDNYQTATAFAKVVDWNAGNDRLVIGGAQGQWKVNNEVRAVSTNAVYNIASFDASPLKLTNITIEPDPITAGPEDDYGYTTTVVEWPDTEV
jgi:hypothetical protein